MSDLADEAMAALRTVPLVERSYVLGVLTWTEPEAVLAAIDTWRNDPGALEAARLRHPTSHART